ncbi:hypothetical protein DAEQUDRAFT_721235 [Daedalea quercina L-15889]|uniref:RING-type domain-containing protein n=1 Tax=Daedalea quercina L-15889 TaxID=1314783 RepID=A0A165TQ51_9APHY|nr:hypothetical protein DAEQUDRAFT_721235 [Daedalea quercina L-15889]
MPPYGLRLTSEPASPTSELHPSAALSHMSTSRSYVFESTAATLKRRASPSFEDVRAESSRKRLKDDSQDTRTGGNDNAKQAGTATVDGEALADELEQELQCACCSALVYRPVIVIPCQHFFCGSCVVMWIRNGGTNCPACRGLSSVVTPSRALQTMVDVLLHHAPDRARPANERIQADEIYRTGVSLRIPSPRQASPEPNIQPRNVNYVQPCPHCAPGNQYGWVCPQPIADPETDPDHAWHTDEGTPPGHAYCGNCENILALTAPTTTKCDFCQVSFCGIGIPTRCLAIPVHMQHPHGLSDIGDLIQCGEIYDCFHSNTVEVDIMLDYLTAQRLTPKHIYREIVAYLQAQPRQFAPLIERDLFQDMHSVAGGVDPGPDAPRSRICRLCATEVFLWGLPDWWVRERKKGFLEEYVIRRPDCPYGSECDRQKDHGHAKEYNHIIAPRDIPTASSSTLAGSAGMSSTSARPAPLYLPLGSSSSSRSALPPFLPPVPPYEAEADLALLSQLSAAASAPASSQDFRDEVDAML